MRLVLAFALYQGIASFQPLPTFSRHSLAVHSSIGGDGGPPPPDDGDNGPIGDFLDGFGREESDGLRKAREYMSDESLPISFDSEDDVEDDEEEDFEEEDSEIDEFLEEAVEEANGGEIVYPTESMKTTTAQDFFEEPSEEVIRNNPYMSVVSSLTPSDLISKFTSTAHPRVQNAVRSTILGLIGSLPKMAFETTTITTGERLASVMFQLQMTGYLFKNAEYRLSLSQSLGSMQDSTLMLPGADDDDEDDEDRIDPLKGKVKGKLKIKYSKPDKSEEEGEDDNSAAEMEVDAAAYMSELRSEVSQLRDDLTLQRKEKEEALRKDLLLYIRTLPEQQLQSLTGTISQDVLIAMKGLVNVVMAGIGEGQIAAETVTEQSGEAMAQLCMWQLVVGYNLRELEVREEMKKSLLGSSIDSEQTEEGADFSEPGVFD